MSIFFVHVHLILPILLQKAAEGFPVLRRVLKNFLADSLSS